MYLTFNNFTMADLKINGMYNKLITGIAVCNRIAGRVRLVLF
jgi:hypothetical protein